MAAAATGVEFQEFDAANPPPPTTAILAEPFVGLRSQALGLTEAAGLAAQLRTLHPRGLLARLPPEWWPRPLARIAPEAVALPWPDLMVGCGGKAASVLAALAAHGPANRMRRVIVQHPRMPPGRFDLAVVARHDRLSGRNVIVTRTALHQVTPAKLAAAASIWRDRLAHLPRPLVCVMVGGSNGRFRLGPPEGAALASALAGMMRQDRVGLALTPSRRTDPVVTRHLAATLRPLGAFVHDLTGDNPYLGMLALADAIVVTGDSVSMVSEAVATQAPVLVVALPGRSRRIADFLGELARDGRVRPFSGRLEMWDSSPLDDTPAAAAEMRRRLGF